jgi:ABC-type Zn uptake system ZnuABC Zn-binding protein ZnuA
MNPGNPAARLFFGAIASLMAAAGSAAAQSEKPLNVCATVPSLGGIAREVGGGEVSVTVFAKGSENPHFVDARPSFVKTLSTADVFLQQGMELEAGWAPVLLQQCRRAQVQPGAPGFLDVSSVVERLEVPTGPVDRSMGDVHPAGNPHYMTDPLNGIAVARLIRDRLSQLRPSAKAGFEGRCAEFERKVCAALVGEKLASQYPTDTVTKLARLAETGKLKEFLEKQGRLGELGGWLGALLPYAGTRAVSDHNSWVYFGRRFGIELVGYLEPKPGITPTTAHLGEIVKTVQERGVRLVIVSPGFDRRSGEFVASRTSARLLELAHEVGAEAGADSYVDMIDFDVEQILSALQQS